MNSKLLWLAAISVLGLIFIARQNGCGSIESAVDEVHGPHGGHTLKMSRASDYLMEFTVDLGRRKIVIYTYEEPSHSPFPIPVSHLDAEFKSGGKSYDLTFAADPRTSDPQGNSSRFSISLDELPQQIMNASRFTIDVSYTVGGNTMYASMVHSNNHQHEYHHD